MWLGSALSERAHHLEHLDLDMSGHRLTSVGAILLGTLHACGRLRRLCLDLSRNITTADGDWVDELYPFLNMPGLEELRLVLEHNGIADHHLPALLHTFREPRPKLRALELCLVGNRIRLVQPSLPACLLRYLGHLQRLSDRQPDSRSGCLRAVNLLGNPIEDPIGAATWAFAPLHSHCHVDVTLQLPPEQHSAAASHNWTDRLR